MQLLKLFLCLISCFISVQSISAQAPVLNKKISINVINISLEEVIRELEEKTNTKFTYPDKILVENQKITLKMSNRPLQDILNELIKDSNITYKVINNRVIFSKQKAPKTGDINTQKTIRKFTISGYLKDAATGEVIIGANIFDSNSQFGTSTNPYGFFSITLPEGEVKLLFSYIGYKGQEQTFKLNKDIQLLFELSSSVNLEEIVITADKYSEKIEEQTLMSSFHLSMNEVKQMPVIGGEVDVLKTLQLLPGVQSGNEGFSGIYIRGGSPDQNLILLDGVPVYNPSHLFGLFSVFNADAINSTTLIKGGIPARYGERLSSIIDIRMKEGNNKKWTGQSSIGLVASKLTIEGPLIKDKMSIMVSARRTYADLFAKPIIKNENEGEKRDLKFNFIDLYAKTNYQLSDKDNIYLSFYNGHDQLFDQTKTTTNTITNDDIIINSFERNGNSIEWGNTIAAFRWNHLFGNKLFSNVTLNYTKYNFEVFTELFQRIEESNAEKVENLDLFRYTSKVRDFIGKIDFDYLPTPVHSIKFGFETTQHNFKPGVTAIQEQDTDISINRDTTFGDQSLTALKLIAYIEDNIKISKDWSINAGLHTSIFLVKNTQYLSLEPRIISRYNFLPSWSFKTSFTQLNQQLHLLTNSGVGLPTDLWVLPTDKIKPQKSWQTAAGIAHTFKKGIELTVETYYKKMKNLIAYREGTSFLVDSYNWEEKITEGQGWSYGGEFLLRKKTGKTTGWLAYTLSWTKRQFNEINFGKKYPFRFDRRHDIALFIAHRFNEKFSLSANWVYATGVAITLPIRQFTTPDLTPDDNTYQDIYNDFDYGSKNNFRMRAYHRLDLSLSYFKKGKWGDHIFNLSIYNVYNRHNPFYIDVNIYSNDQGGSTVTFQETSLLPIIPSLRWDFKF